VGFLDGFAGELVDSLEITLWDVGSWLLELVWGFSVVPPLWPATFWVHSLP
jgi:hypothetical protein